MPEKGLIHRIYQKGIPNCTYLLTVKSASVEASPGCFTYLGIRNETCGAVHGLHTAKFTLDENVLPRGSALHAAVAFEFLANTAKSGHEEL